MPVLQLNYNHVISHCLHGFVKLHHIPPPLLSKPERIIESENSLGWKGPSEVI